MLFWCATIGLILCAAGFIIPPLWLTTGSLQLSSRMQITYSGLLVLLLVIFSYFAYFKIGASKDLFEFYRPEFIAQQQMYQRVQPLYARIQQEMVKNQLNLKLDLENVELILNFAQIHSQAQDGKLQPDIQRLLHAVLQAIPQQVTALNLLAIHAYKTEQYAQAISYWQAILQQFTPEMRNSEVEQVLQNKIAATKLKITNL